MAVAIEGGLALDVMSWASVRMYSMMNKSGVIAFTEGG